MKINKVLLGDKCNLVFKMQMNCLIDIFCGIRNLKYNNNNLIKYYFFQIYRKDLDLKLIIFFF